MNRFATILGLILLPALAATSAAQDGDVVDRAKVQYESAAYEDALTILDNAGEVEPSDRVQVEQYRALCFIALGRLDDAQRAIAALVATDPTYVPSASIASPKVLSIIADIRKRELPAIVRRLMDEGRTAYKKKEMSAARRQFELVSRLLGDPSMGTRPETEDLKTVVRGFLDLTAAVEASAAPAAAAAKPSNDFPPTTERAASADVFVPAIPLQQTLPAWEPPGRAFATVEYAGSIRVHIGVDGKVKSVAIERPSHPAYDARLLQIAQSWLYKPATRNGKPVESDKVIAVRLQPPPTN